MPTAVYAGSFDPVTRGHLWMIREGARLFGGLAVAIGDNPAKRYTFDRPTRRTFLEDATRGIPGVSVDVFENRFLVEYARSVGADYILRGIRNESDYGFERGMRHVNADLDADITTVFLMPPRDLSETSSSLVKGLVGPEGWEQVVEPLVTPTVFMAFQNLANRDGA